MPNEIDTDDVESEIEVGDGAGDLETEETDEETGAGEEEQEASDDADEGGEPKPKAKPDPKAAPKTYRTKSNGKEIDVPAEHVDALAGILGVDPSELVRGAQMLRSGQEKMRAAAEAERKAKALEESAKRDPFAALRQAGLSDADVQKATIAYVARLYEEEQLKKENPVEFEKRQLQAQLDAVKAKETEAEKAREAEEEKAYAEQVSARLDTEIKGLLEKGRIPAHPYAIKRIAAHMLDLSAKGVDPEDISADDFVPVVMEDMRKDFSAFIGTLSGEDVVRLFPDLSEKVRKAHLSRVPQRKPIVRTGPAPDPKPPARKLTAAEVLAQFAK
jgi:hypothetical protein